MARTKELLKSLRALWGRGGVSDEEQLRPAKLPASPIESTRHELIPPVAWPAAHPSLGLADQGGAGYSGETSDEVTQPPWKPQAEEKPASRLDSSIAVEHRAGRAGVPVYADDGQVASKPSAALLSLVDLYLHAARYRTRLIAMTWPASLRTAVLVHVLATLERWQDGDKQGVRGLLYPVKSNAFHVLNHHHLDREAVLRHARNLVEGVAGVDDSHLVRRMRDKDPFLFALQNLKPEAKEAFNPTTSELLPHFYAGENFQIWTSCESRLLSHINAKLERRPHKKALRDKCDVLGNPDRAPDALFAVDGRLEFDNLRRALLTQKVHGPPEVVLVIANRQEREELGSWKTRLAKFCLLLEETYPGVPPGVLVLTDQPRAAFDLRQELLDRNQAREKHLRWKNEKAEYVVTGIPCPTGDAGLLPPGADEPPEPLMRVFDVDIVDADAAKIVSLLWRAVHATAGGPERAGPLKEAASFIGRIASLPCGLDHLAAHLASHDFTDRSRQGYDWQLHRTAIHEFDKAGTCPEGRKHLLEAMKRGDEVIAKSSSATAFAHLVATHAARAAKGEQVTIVFASSFQCFLAERFLSTYGQFPSGARFEDFKDRVSLVTNRNLEESLQSLGKGQLVFAGLGDESLRVLMADNRVPAHTAVLLTQSAAQFLRANLAKIRQYLPALNRYAPRIDSILQQLKDLPESRVPLGSTLAPPPFRLELSSEVAEGKDVDPNRCWAIHLEDGSIQHRVDGEHLVHVYDPISQRATERGFKTCKVASLSEGDKLLVMTHDLRELIEDALQAAGIPLQSDKGFEGSLRAYHERVIRGVSELFPAANRSAQVRAIRAKMIEIDPKIAADLPREETTRHWLDLGASATTDFERLRPQAPGKEAHYKLFTQALGFSPLEAAVHWQNAIQPVRNSRRLDSRYLSERYAHLLLQPESEIVKSNLTRRTVQNLFDLARESVVAVTAVHPPKDPA